MSFDFGWQLLAQGCEAWGSRVQAQGLGVRVYRVQASGVGHDTLSETLGSSSNIVEH